MSNKVVQVVLGGVLSFVYALVLHSSVHTVTTSSSVNPTTAGQLTAT